MWALHASHLHLTAGPWVADVVIFVADYYKFMVIYSLKSLLLKALDMKNRMFPMNSSMKLQILVLYKSTRISLLL